MREMEWMLHLVAANVVKFGHLLTSSSPVVVALGVDEDALLPSSVVSHELPKRSNFAFPLTSTSSNISIFPSCSTSTSFKRL